ncbi:hypothetical protein K8I61_18265 [bacterium]|nr:hypothetical protein [bacterium]
MRLFLAIFALLLAAFGVLHLFARRTGGAAADAHYDRRDPTYYALAIALGAFVAAAAAEAISRGVIEPSARVWIGRALVVAAVPWTLWCRREIGANYTSTARNLDPKQTLVASGPYRLLRHPIYAGNAATVTGLALALDVRWAWIAVGAFLALVAWRVRVENAFLAEKFGGLTKRALRVDEEPPAP